VTGEARRQDGPKDLLKKGTPRVSSGKRRGKPQGAEEACHRTSAPCNEGKRMGVRSPPEKQKPRRRARSKY